MHDPWQADLSRRPQTDAAGNPLWELLLCSADGQWQWSAQAPQAEITAAWVTHQLQTALQSRAALEPSPIAKAQHPILQVFRPQSFSLIAAGAKPLGLNVEATRQTPAIKQILQTLVQSGRNSGWDSSWDPVAIEQLPPQPLPERLRGDRWQFAALPAGELVEGFRDRPIPILHLPQSHWPLSLGLASTLPIPGVIIEAGRAAMPLARWLQTIRPYRLHYSPGAPDGVILAAGLAERWVMATFEDADMARAARTFQQRQQAAAGLHFLLIQPDDSGMTYSGFWLLRSE